MRVVQYKKIYLGISLLMVGLAIAAIMGFGFRWGIDFTGGSLWQISFEETVSRQEIIDFFQSQGFDQAQVTKGSDESFLVRLSDINEAKHQELKEMLEAEKGEIEELSFQSIGPSIGAELRKQAIIATVLVLLGISLYVAFAFRKVSEPIKSWLYGATTLITLFHDVIIAAGFVAFLNYLYGVAFDTNMVVALLVIAGFSVHDTIVVFDRIRENLLKDKKSDLVEVVDNSIKETLARSVNTSATLIFVLVALMLVGPANLVYFVAVILIGTVVGTYSSILVASPLLTVWTGVGR